jgi:hypothetical protein
VPDIFTQPTSVLDREKFYQDVLDIIHDSPLAVLLNRGLNLHFGIKYLSGDITLIRELAVAIVSSVEIVKGNLKAQYPNEQWSEIALDTAYKILHDSIRFTGFLGKVEDVLLSPIVHSALHMLIEGALGTFKILATNKDWLALARAALLVLPSV